MRARSRCESGEVPGEQQDSSLERAALCISFGGFASGLLIRVVSCVLRSNYLILITGMHTELGMFRGRVSGPPSELCCVELGLRHHGRWPGTVLSLAVLRAPDGRSAFAAREAVAREACIPAGLVACHKQEDKP